MCVPTMLNRRHQREMPASDFGHGVHQWADLRQQQDQNSPSETRNTFRIEFGSRDV